MELNASNDRGIETVRNKIKMFAQQKVTLPQGRHKIIVLDEADSMTESAQQALRRTMELYSSTTRFALACNSSEKIIEPIQSRCAMLRYSKLTDAQVLAKVLAVCEAEGVDHSEDGLEAVVFTAQVLFTPRFSLSDDVSNFFVRATCVKLSTISSPLMKDLALSNRKMFLRCRVILYYSFPRCLFFSFSKVCDEPHPLLVKDMLDHATKADIDQAYKILAHLWELGYSPEDIITNVFRVCKSHSMAEFLKLEFIKEIGRTHLAMAQGTSSLLQVHCYSTP